MKHRFVALVSLALIAGALTGAAAQSRPTLFINADENFQSALSAAIVKKDVPITITTSQDKAEYVLQSSLVSSKQESGASKVARCLFAYCVGIEGSSTVSVRLIRVQDGAVLWAYQVRKGNGGPSGIQSLSEAIAKHLKNDYLKKSEK